MGNNLYSNLVNFYNINDENFKEFMAEIYKEMLLTHRDVQYVKEHLSCEIVKILDKYLVDGKFNVNIEEKVNEFLENNQEIKDITAKLITNTNNIKNISSQLEDITINIKQFGALGDGTTDDAESFIKAIDYCKNNNVFNLYIPSGTYIISKSITIDFPLNIYGVWAGNKIGGTILKYVNTNDEPMLSINDFNGGSLHDMTLLGSGVHDCIKTKNVGWDNSFYNLRISDFQGSGMNLNQDDGYFNNIFITDCGSSRTTKTSNIRYAILIGETYHSNALHFNNLHVEHCQYMCDIKDGFCITFDNCKFEQSFSRFGKEITSPILIESEIGITFNACLFIGVNPLAHLKYDKNIEIASLPYFVHCTSTQSSYGAIKLSACTFTAGSGSGDATLKNMPAQMLAIKSDSVPLILVGNSFSYLATYAPPIIENGKSTITGNTIHSVIFQYNNILNSDNADISNTLNSLDINGCTFGNRSVINANRFYHDVRSGVDINRRNKYVIDSKQAYCINNMADGGYDVDTYFYKDISTTRNPGISYLEKGNKRDGDYNNVPLGGLYFSTGYDCFRYKDSKGIKSLLNNRTAVFTPIASSSVLDDNTIFFDGSDNNKLKVKINGTIYTVSLS